MDFSIDLRFLFPPLLNLTVFFLFLKFQDGSSWAVPDGVNQILLYPILKLEFSLLIFVVMPLALLLFLTPIRLPMKVSRPIIEWCGKLSVVLAISVASSVILAPFLFLVAYLCLIIVSLCYATFAFVFNRCFNWFRRTVITPTGNIFNRNQEMEEPAPLPPPQAEENIQIVVDN